jgi:hypothetical protein
VSANALFTLRKRQPVIQANAYNPPTCDAIDLGDVVANRPGYENLRIQRIASAADYEERFFPRPALAQLQSFTERLARKHMLQWKWHFERNR